MSDAVDQKAVELMDKAATAVEAFAGKLDTLAKEYGPEVVDAALMVARADAATALIHQLAGVGVLALLIYLSIKATKAVWQKDGPGRSSPDFGAFITLLSAGVPGGVCFLIWVKFVGDVWPLVGVIEPKLWIAKRVLGL